MLIVYSLHDVEMTYIGVRSLAFHLSDHGDQALVKLRYHHTMIVYCNLFVLQDWPQWIRTWWLSSCWQSHYGGKEASSTWVSTTMFWCASHYDIIMISLSKNPIGDVGFIKVLDAMEKSNSTLKGLGYVLDSILVPLYNVSIVLLTECLAVKSRQKEWRDCAHFWRRLTHWVDSSECTINALLTVLICTAELAVIQSKMKELNFSLMESRTIRAWPKCG